MSASHAFLSEGQGFDVAVVDLSLPDSDEAELIEELPSAIDETERLARTEGT